MHLRSSGRESLGAKLSGRGNWEVPRAVHRSRDDLFRDRRPIGGSDRRGAGCDIKSVVVSNGHVPGIFQDAKVICFRAM